jgi:hypothetical protein
MKKVDKKDTQEKVRTKKTYTPPKTESTHVFERDVLGTGDLVPAGYMDQECTLQ